MKVDFAFVCDYADPGNKLGALGIGFDTIYAPQVPCLHSSFHLVVRVRSEAAEAGPKDVEVALRDAEGKDVIPPLPVALEVRQPEPGAEEATATLVVGFAAVLFPAYGQYTLHVAIQGNEMVRIPIRVAQPPATG